MGNETETFIEHKKTAMDLVKNNEKTKSTKRLSGILSFSLNDTPGKATHFVNGKNPISILNELFFDIIYELKNVTGPAHCPIFEVSVKIKDYSQAYYGTGTSKKLAKNRAALNALCCIFNIENQHEGTNKSKLMPNVKDDILSTLNILPQLEVIKSERKNSSTEINESIIIKDDIKNIQKPSKQRKTEILLTEKNPVSILNELRVDVKYEVESVTGPPHNPIFSIFVEVDGQKYYGTGQSKKVARARAAEEALKSFIQFPRNGIIIKTSVSKGDSDFTSDKISESHKEAPVLSPRDKNPVMLLNELYPNVVYSFTHNEADVVNRFKTTITIDNVEFIGTGSSKKNSKAAAAKIALAKLISFIPQDGIQNSQSELGLSTSRESLLKADGIGRLINEKFAEVMAGDLQHTKRKVLAGIVMTRSATLEDAEIICVSTGTKCVSGGHICLNGSSLNDMHAEIIARRCLVSYLYDQLEMLTNPDTACSSIFTKRDDESGYKLIDGIEFHLYINTAPCGDARIFTPHEANPSIDRHPNRISRGQLRTKIESGEGTIPIKGIFTQTWDGIIQGERLLTMSCSDKICKWNVVGLQGALLSHFIEPIYLKSIVLGALMKETHLYRAISGRIENTLQGLPPPFFLNRPEMLKITSQEIRQAQKAPTFSVIWMKGMEKPEIVSTEKGKPSIGISLVCKQNLAQKFFKLHNKLSTISSEQINMSTYGEAKESVKTYVAARQALYEAFKKAQLGNWVTKPLEQDMFGFLD